MLNVGSNSTAGPYRVLIRALGLLAWLFMVCSYDSAHAWEWPWSEKKPVPENDQKQIKDCLETINILNGAKQDNWCPLKNPGAPVPSAPVKDIKKARIEQLAKPAATNQPSGEVVWPKFKSDDDLLLYLECYDSRYKQFKIAAKEYLPLIESAAKEFGLPKVFMTCLIFKESQFRKDARSNRNAQGLGQHMPGTMKVQTNILAPMPRRELERWKFTDENSVEDVKKKYSTNTAQTLEDKRVANIVMRNQELATSWESLFSKLKKKNLFNGATPRRINSYTIRTPAVAIAATALHLKYILNHFERKLDDEALGTPEGKASGKLENLLLAVAGAYNAGEGNAVNAIKPVFNQDYSVWVEKLKLFDPETASYIISIKNCAQPPTKSNSGWLPPIPDPPKNCQAEDFPILGPPTELPPAYRKVKKDVAKKTGTKTRSNKPSANKTKRSKVKP